MSISLYDSPFNTISSLNSDGVTRTGTFISIHSQLERLKTEGAVDVFQAIKSARIQRPGVIPNLVCSLTIIAHYDHVFNKFHLCILILNRLTMSSVMKYWLVLWRQWIPMPTSRQ